MSRYEINPPKITVLTPTWNRQVLLRRLYHSLAKQEVSPGSFEWLVVDDGSTDGTVNWLHIVAKSAPFPIRILRQENGGKHRALNRGAKEAAAPWVVILDSDDRLQYGGMQRVLKLIANLGVNPEISAILTRHRFPDGVQAEFDCSEFPISFAQWLHEQPWTDVNHAIRLETLKKFPFAEFDGEKFIAETSFYAAAFKEGGIALSNKDYTIAEYQPDGLSSNTIRLRSDSPRGAMHTYKAHLSAGIQGRKRFEANINYHRFLWHAIKRYGLHKSIRNGFSFFILALAIPLFVRDLYLK